MRIYTILLLVLSISSVAFSQKVDACFTLTKTRFCVGEPVVAQNCIVPQGTTPASGFFNFGDSDVDTNKLPLQGVKFNKDTSHIYNKPGTYRIRQVGGLKPGGGPDDSIIHITILPAQIPVYDVSLCEGYKAVFTIKDNFYNQYTILTEAGAPPQTFKNSYTYTYTDALQKTSTVTGECGQAAVRQFTPINTLIKPDVLNLKEVKNGDQTIALLSFNAIEGMRYKLLQQDFFQKNDKVLDTISGKSGPTSITLSNADDVCYKLVSFDDCGNTDSSQSLCTAKLLTNPVNNAILVGWELPYYPDVDFDYIELFKNGQSVGQFSNNTTGYKDTEVQCGKTYTYEQVTHLTVRNKLNGEALTNTTVTASAVAFSNQKPSALQNLNSTIENGQVKLTWDQPNSAVKQYAISRATSANSFVAYGNSQVNSFTDGGANVPSNSYCYKVAFTDSCNNVANDSLITCPVSLQVSVNSQDQNQETWTNYQNGVNQPNIYFVEKLDESGVVISASQVGTDTFYVDATASEQLSSETYRIKIFINGNATTVSYSNVFVHKNEAMVFLPTAFTPNRDGVNDVLLPFGKYFKDFNISIFNRWGEMVFHSEQMNAGWDGNYQGSPALPDNYVYVVHIKNNQGKEVIKKGDFLLLR